MEVTEKFNLFVARYAPGKEFRFVLTPVRKCHAYVDLPIRYIEPFDYLGNWFLILSDQPKPDELGPIGDFDSPIREMLQEKAREETAKYDRYIDTIAEREMADYEPPCPDWEDK